VSAIPAEIIAYHHAANPLLCKIAVAPWDCEFWPLDKIVEYNKDYQVEDFAIGYFGFATSGGGEMYCLSPSARIVCLAFVGMNPNEELLVADTWQQFEGMLTHAL
jgi:hypothetical protein